jgi:indolepyruvate ferredoxin oxidoreductase
VAYQGGLIPLAAESIEEAIRLNKVEAERNVQAFLWGRKYYDDAPAVERILEPPQGAETPGSLVERRRPICVVPDALRSEYRASWRIGRREPALAEPVARYSTS